MTRTRVLAASAGAAVGLALAVPLIASMNNAGPATPAPPATIAEPSRSPTSTSPATTAPGPATGALPAAPAPTPSASAATAESVDEVVDAVAQRWWAVDTRRDTTPVDAHTRAAEWLTPRFAALNTTDLPAGPGGGFLELAAHKGRYEVTVTDVTEVIGTLPPDSATAANRARMIELVPVGADGWTGSARTIIATFTLTNPGGGWLIDDIVSDEALDTGEGALDAG